MSPQDALCRPEATYAPETLHVVARRLIWFRELRGLTQSDLAKAAGISRSAVNDAESGQSDTRLRTLVQMAAALGTDAGVLFGSTPLPDAERAAYEAKWKRPF